LTCTRSCGGEFRHHFIIVPPIRACNSFNPLDFFPKAKFENDKTDIRTPITSSTQLLIATTMAEQEQTGRVAAWPNPPPFYEHFTPENIQRIDALRDEEKSKNDWPLSANSNASIRIFDLPPELRFLQPPGPPANGEYRAFGGLWKV
jgi:hypothetical protein